jgi:hypothetical protein
MIPVLLSARGALVQPIGAMFRICDAARARVAFSRDVERYGCYLADQCVLVMNNAEPVVGKEAVLAGLSHYWRSFGELEHELLNIYGTDRAFMLEALNHYRRLDGRRITLRAVALTDRDEVGKATSVKLYTDTGPPLLPVSFTGLVTSEGAKRRKHGATRRRMQ